MIILRYKPLKSGKYSVYMDIYSCDKSGNKSRQYEFLKLQVTKDYSKMKNIASEDKDTIALAESIRGKRELEITGEMNGLKVGQKTTHHSFSQFIELSNKKNPQNSLKALISLINKFTDNKDVRFIEVTPDWLEQFKTFLLKKVSINTTLLNLNILRAKLNEAIRQDIITINPFDKIKLPTKQETKKTTLDVEDIEKLIEAPFPEYPYIRLAFLFSCFSGLRISDLFSIKWENIVKTINKEGETTLEMHLKPFKTRNTTGMLLKAPLTEPARMILEHVKKMPTYDPTRIIFNRVYNFSDANEILRRWQKKAGVKKHLHFHVGRHTFATLCLTYGIDVYTVQKLMGHSEVKQTEVYAKIVDEKKRMEIQKLPIFDIS
jgi:integrase